MIFQITKDLNGLHSYEFQSKHDIQEEMTDEKLVLHIKENSKDISQRKINGKEVDVYVYKFIGP